MLPACGRVLVVFKRLLSFDTKTTNQTDFFIFSFVVLDSVVAFLSLVSVYLDILGKGWRDIPVLFV